MYLPNPPLTPSRRPRGSQPCVIFVGEKFESVPALALAKSLLLDMFRGEPVDKINLAGIDRVVMAGACHVRYAVRQQPSRAGQRHTRKMDADAG
jgi:ribosome production factor 2